MADLLQWEGQLAAALPYLARRAQLCTQAIVGYAGWRTAGVPTYFYYDPSAEDCLAVDTDRYGVGWSDPATRVRVYYVSELDKQLADAYFYELHDYRQTAPYYKKYLAYLDAHP